MAELILNVQERSVSGRQVKHLRSQGLIPAVVYGGDQPVASLQIARRDLDHLMAAGTGVRLVSLVGERFPKTRVLIREVQRHPVHRNVLHVDFVRVSTDTQLQTQVPLVFTGKAPVEDKGGIVLQNANALLIRCLPDDLPAQIEVDISHLANFNQQITAGELTLPEGVALADESGGDFVLVSVGVPRGVSAEGEEEELLAEEPTGAEPEVISKGKEEEDEEKA